MGGSSPQPPKDAKRRAEHAWAVEEDALLRRLVDKYPSNWSLVADAFNSSRVTASIDKRTSWECFERWSVRHAANRLGPSHSDVNSPANLDGTPPPTPSASPVQMTTRGIKRLANMSIVQNQSTSLGANISSDMLKRRRHTVMYETIRKVAKKREAAQKASSSLSFCVYQVPLLTEVSAVYQKKSSNVHDTHSQYSKMPIRTPAELSRMKTEKDQQEIMLMAQRKREELTRQQLMRDPRLQVSPAVSANALTVCMF